MNNTEPVDFINELIEALHSKNNNLYKKLPQVFIKKFDHLANSEHYLRSNDVHLIEQVISDIVAGNDFSSFMQIIDCGLRIELLTKDYFLCACQHGSLEIAQYLYLNHKDSIKDKAQPIHRSASNGHLPVVNFLIENGFDIHSSYDAPLRLAATYNRLEVVDYLLEHGADVSNMACDIFDRIATENHFEMFKKCVDHYLENNVTNLEVNNQPSNYRIVTHLKKAFKKIFEHFKEKYHPIYVADPTPQDYIVRACVAHKKVDMIDYLIHKNFNFEHIINNNNIEESLKTWIVKSIDSKKLYENLSVELIDKTNHRNIHKNNDIHQVSTTSRNKI